MSQSVFASDPAAAVAQPTPGLAAAPAPAEPPNMTLKLAAIVAGVFIYCMILGVAYLSKDQTTMSNLEVGGLSIVTVIMSWVFGSSADSASKTATLANIASGKAPTP